MLKYSNFELIFNVGVGWKIDLNLNPFFSSVGFKKKGKFEKCKSVSFFRWFITVFSRLHDHPVRILEFEKKIINTQCEVLKGENIFKWFDSNGKGVVEIN